LQDQLFELFSLTLNIDPRHLSDETSPGNTEAWDSLANMLLIAGIEETFDVELTTSEIESMKSLADVRRVLIDRGVAAVA
jgi:acyl carrier protein